MIHNKWIRPVHGQNNTITIKARPWPEYSNTHNSSKTPRKGCFHTRVDRLFHIRQLSPTTATSPGDSDDNPRYTQLMRWQRRRCWSADHLWSPQYFVTLRTSNPSSSMTWRSCCADQAALSRRSRFFTTLGPGTPNIKTLQVTTCLLSIIHTAFV